MYFCVDSTDESGQALSENRILEIQRDGRVGLSSRVPLVHPLNNYMTAMVCAGSLLSRQLDLLGPERGLPDAIRFAQAGL